MDFGVWEKKRVEELETRKLETNADRNGGLPDPKGLASKETRRKAKAWTKQKDAKSVREERRDKKHVRRENERLAQMSVEERQKERELQDMIGEVRRRGNVLPDMDEEFEGFGD